LLRDRPETVPASPPPLRHQQQLPEGAVLVVGAGPPGGRSQGAGRAGRRVFLSVGRQPAAAPLSQPRPDPVLAEMQIDETTVDSARAITAVGR